jgi:polyisoprenyl-teichoic acid--peptidoglycan teichoic acid transferase
MEKSADKPSGRGRRSRLFLFLVSLTLIAGSLLAVWLNAGSSDDGIADRIRRDLLTRPLNQGDPINILLIGSDTRQPGKSGLSDTLILMHVNFEKRRIYLISIPRDSRVYIPGQGYDKINAAYAYGQAPLAIRTVEQLLDVDLNHYIEVDFQGFKQMVDTLGGIDITIDQEIDDRSPKYRMHIPKGRQRMDGETALNYVRYRHGDSDFERAKRQQNFLRALAANTLTLGSVTKLPKLVEVFDGNVTTDLSKTEMLALGKFLREVPEERLETVTLAGTPRTIDEISYVELSRAFIDRLIDVVKSGRSVKSVKTGSESDKISMNTTSIHILNGTGIGGLASQAKIRLRVEGLSGVTAGNARRSDYRQTQINYRAEDQETAELVRRVLFRRALMMPTGAKAEGVEVILGSDYNQL